MTQRDIRIGLIGILIGTALGVATALTGSDGALEGWILRRPGTQRLDHTQLQMIRTHVRGALRK